MKTKLMNVSEFSKAGSEALSDCVCAATGKQLAKIEASTVQLSIDVGGGNTIGSGVLYFGPGNGPTAKRAKKLLELLRTEIVKWGK